MTDYFQVQMPYRYEYLHLDLGSDRRCSVCLFPIDRMGWSSSVPDTIDDILFLSRDFRVIARRELDPIWEADASILPVGPSVYRQILPAISLEMAPNVVCRETEMCESGNHHSRRLGCNDSYLRPREDLVVASSQLPRGSGFELYFPFFVREDVDSYLRKHVLGYRSSKVLFAD